MIGRSRAAFCVVGLMLSGPLRGEETMTATLPTLIVTPSGASGGASALPHGVSIVTRADIERAGPAGLAELLSREAGINLRSFTGNDKFASVDLRGMGDTAVSNVLILVDGVKLNEVDLSGADLSSVPLSSIDRIEIVRGGGAVRWGDGAVGGTINIVTRKPRAGGPHGSAGASVASYDGRSAFVDVGGGAGAWRGRAAFSASRTDGYRQNSELDREDGSFELRYLPASQPLELFGRVSVHRDRYGLPGPVGATAFAGSEAARRASAAPFDGGKTDDRMLTLGANIDMDSLGRLEWQTHWRDRENPFLIGFSPLLPVANQASRIESDKLETQIRYSVEFDAFGRGHDFGLGAHYQTADYVRAENGTDVVDTSSRRVGDLTSQGLYAETTLHGPGGLSMNLGARANRTRADTRDERFTRQCNFVMVGGIPVPMDCIDAFRVQSQRGNVWHDQAYELGVAWEIDSARMVFASVNRHFRAPNIDELAFADSDLHPQNGRTLEAGMRVKDGRGGEFAATLFDMRIDDEIAFGLDPVSGQSRNRNYDQPTHRLGLELQGRLPLSREWSVIANAAYVRPRFEGTNADIPLVPRRTASLSVEWETTPALLASAAVRYAGRRHDGNDPDNNLFPSLPAYTVADIGLRYRAGALELSAAVNNLFDEIYSTVGFSATYYPMPGRNYQAGMRWRF